MESVPLTARFATDAELEVWDDRIGENADGGDFLASRAFATAKKTLGWEPRFVVCVRDEEIVSRVLVLARRVPLLGTLWFIPRGPAATDWPSLETHLRAVRALAAQERPRVFTVTFEPPITVDDPITAANTLPDAVRALDVRPRAAIQGNSSTAIVALDHDDDALLAGFDKKCRNMIRRAQRDGVTVRRVPPEPDTFAAMHRLMRLVGGGTADLALRPAAYTEAFWHSFTASGHGEFFAIDAEGEPAVMGFLVLMGQRAVYKDGGSERERVSPGMSNLLLWEMMRFARDRGAREIDLFGIAPAWARSTADHPSYGLGLFKLSFARARTEYAGAFDLVLRPGAFALWNRVGERLVARLHRRRTGDLGLY